MHELMFQAGVKEMSASKTSSFLVYYIKPLYVCHMRAIEPVRYHTEVVCAYQHKTEHYYIQYTVVPPLRDPSRERPPPINTHKLHAPTYSV